jgi:CheY-like chemotaxis protein
MLVEDIVALRPEIFFLAATNGNQGIEIARAVIPDVILMDVFLPDINGFEATIILKQDPVTANIPVIAISSQALPEDIEKGMAVGFFRYLTKPFKLTEFMETLDMALKSDEEICECYEGNARQVEVIGVRPTGRVRGGAVQRSVAGGQDFNLLRLVLSLLTAVKAKCSVVADMFKSRAITAEKKTKTVNLCTRLGPQVSNNRDVGY